MPGKQNGAKENWPSSGLILKVPENFPMKGSKSFFILTLILANKDSTFIKRAVINVNHCFCG